VVLSVRLDAIGIKQINGLGAVGGKFQVVGREEAKRVLKGLYGDLRSGLSVTTEIISGYDVALLGNFALRSTKEDTKAFSLPIAIHMAFDYEGKVQKMTIAAVDLNPLLEAIRAAAQSCAGNGC